MTYDDFKYVKCPDDFLWSAATSAYQVKGAWNEDVKGPSIYDFLTHTVLKWISLDFTPLPWVSESFRQDIGKFLGPCKLGDYFISNKYIYYDKFDRFA